MFVTSDELVAAELIRIRGHSNVAEQIVEPPGALVPYVQWVFYNRTPNEPMGYTRLARPIRRNGVRIDDIGHCQQILNVVSDCIRTLEMKYGVEFASEVLYAMSYATIYETFADVDGDFDRDKLIEFAEGIRDSQEDIDGNGDMEE